MLSLQSGHFPWVPLGNEPQLWGEHLWVLSSGKVGLAGMLLPIACSSMEPWWFRTIMNTLIYVLERQLKLAWNNDLKIIWLKFGLKKVPCLKSGQKNNYFETGLSHLYLRCILTDVLPLVLQLDAICFSGIELDNFCVSIMSVTYFFDDDK